MKCTTLFAVALVGIITTTAAAQVPIEASGTIVGVEGTRIGIRDAQGNIFQADVTQSWRGPDNVIYTSRTAPSVIVTGTEDPKNLRVGQALQFTATMAGRKTIVGEVTNGTLITLTPESRVGILNADPVEDAPAEGEKKKPANLEECLVVAAITKVKSGAITVTAPPALKSLTFRFKEGTVLTVSGSDMSLARIGDKITAKGTVINLPLFATQDVKIEHSPLVDERPQRKLKPEDVAAKPDAKPGQDPFKLSDEPAGPRKPKVKLELIKTN